MPLSADERFNVLLETIDTHELSFGTAEAIAYPKPRPDFLASAKQVSQWTSTREKLSTRLSSPLLRPKSKSISFEHQA